MLPVRIRLMPLPKSTVVIMPKLEMALLLLACALFDIINTINLLKPSGFFTYSTISFNIQKFYMVLALR
jgi:hypothetical protein